MIMHLPRLVAAKRQRVPAAARATRPLPHRRSRPARGARRTRGEATATGRRETAGRRRSRRNRAARPTGRRGRPRRASRARPRSMQCRSLRASRSARGCWSTATASTAPREAASSESAPEPAYRSRQRRPVRSCPSQLNSVSRTRSGVGRRPGTAGKRTRRPRKAPPMMRTRFARELGNGGARVCRTGAAAERRPRRAKPVKL